MSRFSFDSHQRFVIEELAVSRPFPSLLPGIAGPTIPAPYAAHIRAGEIPTIAGYFT